MTKQKKMDWFWIAFISIFLIGTIATIILKDTGAMFGSITVIVLMGLGRLLTK